MNLSTLSRTELLNKCKTLNLKNYKSKTKQQLIEFINNSKLKMVDLFAGTGAFTLAFEKTGFVKCVFANDMSPSSKTIYDENFNHKLTLGDLNDVKVEDIPAHDILTGGFPCFVKGTNVLTNVGYKNIEDVVLNDKLLTHTGQFQNIVNLQKKVYNENIYDIKIKYHPNLITCTEEHPFYVRTQIKKWNNEMRCYDYSYNNPEWKIANKLTQNDYFGMVINTNNVIPVFTFDKKINQTTTTKISIKLDTIDQWFMMGYFVGDGWIEETVKKNGNSSYKIRFAINNTDEKEVINCITKILPITDKKCDTGKCKKFGCGNFIWFNILKQFGKYAHGKLIPEWVQDAPNHLINAFINGYNKADGCTNKNDVLQITTVSYDLAMGLQRLYLKLGHIFSINKTARAPTTIIQNRIVNQRDTYCIRGKLSKVNECGFIEDNYAWFKSSSINIKKSDNIQVYNFEVENDNSYVVENVIVHNCQPFSIAGKQQGFQDPRANVFWKILEIIDYHKPKYVILENVKNLTSHDDENTFKTIKTKLNEKGYFIQFKVLNTSDITDIPQHRERIYIVCIKSEDIHKKFSLDFDKKEKKGIKLLLEKGITDKYYYTDSSKIWNMLKDSIVKDDTVYQYRRVYVRENKNNECPTLTANMGTGGHNVPLILDDKGIRKLTPRECFNFQGFPQTYKLPKISDAQLYKLAGNAVSFPVVELIANRLINII